VCETLQHPRPISFGTGFKSAIECHDFSQLPLRKLGAVFRNGADFKRIDPHRLGDVLEFCLAEIVDRKIEPRLDLPIGVFGKTDGAGFGDAFQSRGDIDAVAHQIAVALLDHIANMNADAELDAALGRKAGVALDHAVLHLDGAAHGVDHAAELNEAPSPVRLTTRPVVHGDVGSIRSLRSARSRASVRSSSEPASRLYPTTSATRIAASFRVSAIQGAGSFGILACAQ
jgi:hypothetical protein